jgi:cbb3-type cytochrome oxidase maturation protein
MEWNNSLLFIFLLGGLFFASAIYMLFWSARNRQFQDFEKGAKSIFDAEEPEGDQTDFFPGKAETVRKALERDARHSERS